MKSKNATLYAEVSPSRLDAAANPIRVLLNQLMEDGFTIDEVIAAALYVAGGAMEQSGGVLLPDAPLRQALPPVLLGWEDSRNSQATRQ